MKVSFVNIVPSVWAVIYFFSLFFFLELQSCHSMTVFLGVNVCWYLYRWLLKVWKKRCMQCQWCFAVVIIDFCKIMHSLSLFRSDLLINQKNAFMFDLVLPVNSLLPIEYEKLCFPFISLSFCRLLVIIIGWIGPVVRSLVSTNRWLRGIKTYRFPWYLTLVSANHASSNPGQVSLLIFMQVFTQPRSQGLSSLLPLSLRKDPGWLWSRGTRRQTFSH